MLCELYGEYKNDRPAEILFRGGRFFLQSIKQDIIPHQNLPAFTIKWTRILKA